MIEYLTLVGEREKRIEAKATRWSRGIGSVEPTDVYTMCTLGIVDRPTHSLRFNREWVCQRPVEW